MIDKLRATGTDRSIVAPIILDTLQARAQLRRVEFVKICREQNKVAHEFAHLALRSGRSRAWFADFPECAVTLACNDII